MCREKGRTHVHLLMFGQRRSGGYSKSLLDVDPEKWAREWPHLAAIEVISSQHRADKYVAAQFLKHEECEMDFFNRYLLERTRIEPDYGPCIGAETLDET